MTSLTTPVIHAALARLPPPRRRDAVDPADRRGRPPVRVGFIVLTFSFGGSETETIELVGGCDPALVRFTAIAVGRPQALPEHEPPRDGSFPPILVPAEACHDTTDPRVEVVESFGAAVRSVLRQSDVVLSWGIVNLQDFLPAGPLPKIVIVSKDSGDWAESFLHPNSLVTSSLVANSTTAAGAFPAPMRERVTVIHDGINPARVAARMGRSEQRRAWGLSNADNVVGYLGRIERDKGVGRVVEAIELLPGWTGVFVGVNPNSRYAAELQRHCERAIPGRYRLLGWSHDVGSALGAFDVFCHPSEHEGFSNSIAEAWLAGVPTVYTAATGAVPDVGELGIPVSRAADGREIATAIELAQRSSGVAKHAQQVIKSQFPIAENVRRWTDYLLSLHARPNRARLLLLFPTDVVDAVPAWLAACASTGLPIELCCVVREGAPRPRGAQEYLEGGQPVLQVQADFQVARIINYTRPDLVVTFQAALSSRLIPPAIDIPVLVVARAPQAEGSNWLRWLEDLALSHAEHVHH